MGAQLMLVNSNKRLENEQQNQRELTHGCKMLQMSCEEHDKIAAKSQFITHTTIGR
ncbi:arogenate dehydrogenase, putative [Medicago truncatula]|uniref:Arogenate dehydrogenase, putative n=1 Tax=Medicago truncatula TaxID=3880 RepID=G7KHI9_MEDTR|nr:arogenate dehydrogenase, putative [Medicago truncatula]